MTKKRLMIYFLFIVFIALVASVLSTAIAMSFQAYFAIVSLFCIAYCALFWRKK